MAGLAEPIKLREYNIRNPQYGLEDVYPGKTISRNSKPILPKEKYVPFLYKSPTTFDTTYNKHFQSHFGEFKPRETFYYSPFNLVPQDVKYTPTNHRHPLPENSRCQPIVTPL